MKVLPDKNNSKNYLNNKLSQTKCIKNANGLNKVSLDSEKDSVSFGSLASGTANMMDFVERNGFLCDFLIVDAISMIIPRIIVGLLRDKKETGNFNYKAAAEEAGRELTSGPSMMAIPIVAMLAAKGLMPETHMANDTLKALTHNTEQILVKTANTPEEFNKNLAGQLFDDAFGKHRLSKEETKDLKSKFIKLLEESTTTEKKFFSKNKAFKEKTEAFEKLVSKINNKNVNGTINTTVITLNYPEEAVKNGKKVINNADSTVSAKEFFTDFRNYAKATKKKLDLKQSKESITQALKKIQKRSVNMKFGTAIAAFLAVGGFLIYLPKLYQVSNISPAMESAKRAAAGVVKGGENENS